ncbi:MAG: T9SS type A sorting domain-containing protein, partial [Bacteroidia bacterium]|nr:T9SS type A sorting domain-containing protein [Bacteroidia bacterium]
SATLIINSNLQTVNFELILVDAFGRIVRKSTITSLKSQIPKGDLQSGIYFFDLISDDRKVIQRGKIIVQ